MTSKILIFLNLNQKVSLFSGNECLLQKIIFIWQKAYILICFKLQKFVFKMITVWLTILHIIINKQVNTDIIFQYLKLRLRLFRIIVMILYNCQWHYNLYCYLLITNYKYCLQFKNRKRSKDLKNVWCTKWDGKRDEGIIFPKIS